MNIDAFWEGIFSEEPTRIRDTFRPLDKDERASVFDLLLRIDTDPERIEAQRVAARVAMQAIRTDPAAIPAGALDFARQISRDTGLHLKLTFGASQASIKGDGTLVTEADLDSDRRISAAIAGQFPEHAILSEERQTVYNGEEWAWVLDPIDGTTNFSHGFPCWGVLIALLHFGQPVLGVSDFPALNKHFYALRGSGAFLNDQPIRAAESAPAAFEATQIIAVCSRTVENGPVALPGKVRVSGSSGYDLALLASGVAALTIQSRVYPWDVAAGWVLSQEAGAIIEGMPDADVFPLRRGADCGNLRFAVVGGASVQIVNIAKKAITTRFVAA